MGGGANIDGCPRTGGQVAAQGIVGGSQQLAGRKLDRAQAGGHSQVNGTATAYGKRGGARKRARTGKLQALSGGNGGNDGSGQDSCGHGDRSRRGDVEGDVVPIRKGNRRCGTAHVPTGDSSIPGSGRAAIPGKIFGDADRLHGPGEPEVESLTPAKNVG